MAHPEIPFLFDKYNYTFITFSCKLFFFLQILIKYLRENLNLNIFCTSQKWAWGTIIFVSKRLDSYEKYEPFLPSANNTLTQLFSTRRPPGLSSEISSVSVIIANNSPPVENLAVLAPLIFGDRIYELTTCMFARTQYLATCKQVLKHEFVFWMEGH